MCVNFEKVEVKAHEIKESVADEREKEAKREKSDKELAEQEAHLKNMEEI